MVGWLGMVGIDLCVGARVRVDVFACLLDGWMVSRCWWWGTGKGIEGLGIG